MTPASWNGVCYLASAYCSGDTLAQWIAARRTAIETDMAAEIGLALAEAIQHAHQNGVLHRDIKPQNVLLDPTTGYQNLPFVPKLTDFSIAKLIDSDATQTATETMLGTPIYCLRKSPDNQKLAIAGKDSIVRIHDMNSGLETMSIDTGQIEVNGVDFSPEGLRWHRPAMTGPFDSGMPTAGTC